jgi:hypothetical protein
MEFDDLVVCMCGDRLEVSGDPRILAELCGVLQGAARMAHYLQKKMEHLQAAQRVQAESQKARSLAEYKQTAQRIYRRYKHHLGNGCGGDKKAAMKMVRNEFKLLVVDAMGYIAEGRRMGNSV